MSKSAIAETNLLQTIFQGKAWTNIGATAGTTSLWISLHTADPGELASTAAEGGYAQYTRILTDRSSGANGWSVTSGTSVAVATATPIATVSAPQNTSTSTGTFTHFGVWPSSAATSSGMLYSGTLSPNINYSQNVTPQITTGSSITED